MANLLSTTVNGQLNTGNVIDLGYTVNGSVATTAFRGINFHSFDDYSYLIGKRAGAWTQPLDITFYTGIKYHAHRAYGGHKFYTGGFDSDFAFSIGDGDNLVRVADRIIVNGTMNVNYDQVWTSSGNLHLQYSSSGNIDMNYGGGYTFSHTSFRAPIFYDYNDTNYYLDPNGTSNLLQLNTATRARWNMPRAWFDRSSRTSDQGYWTGTNGWAASDGTWANAWQGGFSGWDIWGEGIDHPQSGQGYVHAQGIVSGQHYATSSVGYGWMMVGAHNATANRYWLRGKWDTTTSGWVEMITTGNIASQSVSYAVTSGTSSATTQTNFAELSIGGLGVATREYVTSQGYLTSLPSHNHDDRYYTESESDGRYLRTGSDSEQEVGLRYASWNAGAARMNTDPRWNESGYDADLGCLHIWAWTAAGVAYGRAGIALYNGSAYQYLTTRDGTSGMFVNNQEIIHSGNIGSQSVNYASSAGNADTVDGYHANNAAGGIAVINANGYWYPPSWINVGGAGIYSGTNNAHLLPNGSSPHGAWEMIGSKGGWSGIYFRDSGNTLMANANDSGFYNANAGWQIEWYNGTLSVSKQANGGGTLATVWDSSNAPRANFGNLMYYQGFELDANTMATNSTGFTYANNAPFYGPIARFSTGGGYDLWIGGAYSGGGNAFYLRTRNGDAGTFNAWREIITSGNIGSQSVNYASSAGNSNTTSQIVFNDLKTNFPSGAGGGHSFASNHYSMGLDSGNGGWDGPHYRDIIIGYHTGVRIGAHYSGIRFYNNSPTTDANNDGNGDGGEALLMTIGGYVGTANHTDVVVNNNLFANVSMRAPIFYDSNDTNYYLDPTSTGTALRISGGIVSTAGNGAVLLKHENSEANAWIFRENAANWGLFWLNAGSQSGQSIGSYTTVGAELFGMNNAVAGFNPSSAWSGTDSSTRAAWMLSNYSGYLWTQGTQYSETDMRAPIFYDSNNTGYYGDFASTSVMNAIRLGTSTNNGTISGGGDWGIRFANDNGWIQFGPANNSWTHIYSDKNFYFNTDLYVNGTRVVLNSGTWSINISGNAASASSVAWSNVSSKPANWLNATNLIEGFEPSGTAKPSGFYESYLGSGNPTGTWFNFINVRHSNPDNGHGFQIGMSYYDNNLWFRSYQGSTSPSFQSWSRALGTNTDPYPSNMDQYVRTSDSVTFGGVTSPTILVNNQSDNTKGYRIWNTSNSSVSAMFVNSANALVIAAGAVDQVQMNKKVYLNGVALGVNVAASATAGRIDASNDIVAYSSSDERLKQNIAPIENALDKVKSLTGVEFDWKPEYKHAHGYEGHDTGIIAQQVQDVMPSAVRTNDTGFLAVRYEKLIGLLIEANKELAARVEELEKKLN